jgi:hypothetical protein
MGAFQYKRRADRRMGDDINEGHLWMAAARRLSGRTSGIRRDFRRIQRDRCPVIA